MAVSWLAVLLLAATALGASIGPIKTPLEYSKCGRVWITVHSPEYSVSSKETVIDAIELNWDFNGCSNVPKQIGLFSGQPTSWEESLSTHDLNSSDGYLVTKIPLGGNLTLPGGWETVKGTKGPHCLWPWVAAGDTEFEAHNCLKIQPTWMHDNVDQLKSLSISKMVIPGTHNAGSWRFNTEISSLARDRFILCQDRSIWEQLVYGIRYFDFRIAYYNLYVEDDDRYWLNHNMVRVRPLVPLLKEIRTFLESTNEVVFLDAHHFPIGFYDVDGTPLRDVHAGLLKIVQRELGPYIASYEDFMTYQNQELPLKSFMDKNKRLLFSYVDNSISSENKWTWPLLPHLWANTNNVNRLYTFLDNAISTSPPNNSRSPLHSAMAQTTPTVMDILLLRGSLRINADTVNRDVSKRLNTTWRKKANIVSTDFFLGNDVIDQSIKISIERAQEL